MSLNLKQKIIDLGVLMRSGVVDYGIASIPIHYDADGNPWDVSAAHPLPVSGTVNAVFAPDRETPSQLYRVKTGMSFPGAIAGDPILAILTINTVTNTFVSETPLWYNGRTKLAIDNADVDTSKLEIIAANALTASELATLILAISSIDLGVKADSPATDATSSWSVIALLKGVWTKLAAVALSQDISHATPPQMVAVTANSSQSAAIHANTKRIKVTAVENDIYIKFGTTASPATAAVGGAGCLYLIDGMSTDWLTVAATTQVAVIARVAGGYANIQEIL
jgi:hypothetical protein